jgi:mRNA interferase RelE/StbE
MKIILTKSFQKAFRKLDAAIQKKILVIIQEVIAAKSLQEVNSVKPMSGYPNYYRIREGNYRVGIFITLEGILEFQDVGPRGDFYKTFP